MATKSPRTRRYIIDIEYTDILGFHPIGVTVTRQGESKVFFGKSLNTLLRQVKDAIKDEEENDA